MQHLQTQGLSIPSKATFLAQKARFSNERITKEEKQEMICLLKEYKQQISHLPLKRRLILFLIYALW